MIPNESNSTSFTEPSLAENPEVRIRATTSDPYVGLKGHDYIKARNLNPPVQRVHTSAHVGLAATEDCK